MPAVPGRRRHKTRAGNPVVELPPPTAQALEPVFVTSAPGHTLQRVYAPSRYDAGALVFRDHGPHNRFDHHRADPVTAGARVDSERAILYAADGLVCCLGEFFADSGEIAVSGVRVATVRSTAELTLLDLRKTAATGVGTTPAIAAIGQRKTSQAWARYLYDHPQLTGAHGLLYAASNTGHDAVAFFERAERHLEIVVDLELGDPSISADVELAADGLHWPIAR